MSAVALVRRKDTKMEDTLGSRLRKLREYQRLSQEQVAQRLGLSKNAIYFYENDSREPSNATLRRMASLYKTSIDYLLGLEKSHTINVSGLTDREKAIIADLVDDLTEKNTR